jgi:transposase-like protein
VGSQVTPLDQLGNAVAGLREAEAARDRAVAAALTGGATWAEIAGVLGVSASAAHKRFRWVRVDADTGVVWREPPLPR